jgi:hypothetical protein
MARIPAGDFWMGSNDGEANEKPAHRIHVDAFEMDVTEVTVAQYGACVSGGACPPASTNSLLCNWGKSDKASHPINCVSVDEAKTYCTWAKKRLPSEEEWEYAARGSDGRMYPWGGEAPGSQLCWTGKGTCAVGSFPSGRSPFGVLDMAGNVWEWTDSHVARGGSYANEDPSVVRGAYRFVAHPERSQDVGFRCASSAPSTSKQPARDRAFAVGEKVPALSFRSPNGRPLALDTEKNNLVIFCAGYASDCRGNILQQIKQLEAMPLAGNHTTQVVWVDDPSPVYAAFPGGLPFAFAAVTPQSASHLFLAWGVQRIPLYYVIDKAGVVRFVHLNHVADMKQLSTALSTAW